MTREWLLSVGFAEIRERDNRRREDYESFLLTLPRHMSLIAHVWYTKGKDDPVAVRLELSSSATFGGDPLRDPMDATCERVREFCRLFGRPIKNQENE